MSGLVDMWTSELAKLKSKGEAVPSTGSAQAAAVARADNEKTASGGGSIWWPTGFARVEKLPALQCSESSLSMLLDCISA